MLRSNILATFLMLLFSNIAKCDEAKINELNLKCLDSVNHKLRPEKESELTGIVFIYFIIFFSYQFFFSSNLIK
jgi:hypothetical protein